MAVESASGIDERLQFLEIDGDTRAALAEFSPTLRSALPEILAEFYGHIRKWPKLAALFQGGAAAMERAGKAQEAHWLSLFSGRFDEGYAASVRKIGLMHSRIGVDPRWYIGGYAFVLGRLYRAASRSYTSRVSPAVAQARTARLLRALNQAVMLDMDIAISIYLEENKAAYDKKLSSLAEAFDRSVRAVVDGVASAATELHATAKSMAATAEESSRQSAAVAAASEQATQNVNAVASATEELSTSVREISQQVGQSSRVIADAVTQASATNGQVQGLDAAVQKIGDVIKLINEIASQTNLLALNATIEAARAGDAGKGFAVVASEVKALANQTAKATEEIAAQISAIQQATRLSVHSIEAITETITRVNETATAIASAVEEQGAATQEIARNVTEAAKGTTQVTANIASVNAAAQQTGAASSQVLSSANELSRSSETLRTEVDAFLREVKAA
jgi:methyl-accepting chemotaxis protein